MQPRVLGVIGGSGLYGLPGLEGVCRTSIDTPFGKPSGDLVQGEIAGTRVVFLPRHGEGHPLPPHQINVRANVCALKLSGVTHLVSVSAVGSMQPDLAPGHVVVVDQYLDWTRHRASTFFEDGIAAHVSFADPVCPSLARECIGAAESAGARVHRGGTYLCMEGPQFSTRAESHLYRSWGVSVIGMTAMPEAKLAREAELPYATIALVTDYDCWHESERAVSVDAVIAVLKQNTALAQRIVAELATRLPDPAESPATGCLMNAVITDKDVLAPEVRTRLGWLLGPYFPESKP